jgi:hypothetical protein
MFWLHLVWHSGDASHLADAHGLARPTRGLGFIGSLNSLLSVRRSHTDLNQACRSEREAHVPLVATTVAASTIWFMAKAISSSLVAAPVSDHFDHRISG